MYIHLNTFFLIARVGTYVFFLKKFQSIKIKISKKFLIQGVRRVISNYSNYIVITIDHQGVTKLYETQTALNSATINEISVLKTKFVTDKYKLP